MHYGTTCQPSCLLVFFLLIFSLTFLPVPPLPCPFLLLCKCLSKTFMYSMWSGQVRGRRQAQPLRCACACMCASVCMYLPVTVCLYVTHLCLTGNHTAAGQEPNEKGVKKQKWCITKPYTHTHPSAEGEKRGKSEEGCAVFQPPCLNSYTHFQWIIFLDQFKHVCEQTGRFRGHTCLVQCVCIIPLSSSSFTLTIVSTFVFLICQCSMSDPSAAC